MSKKILKIEKKILKIEKKKLKLEKKKRLIDKNNKAKNTGEMYLTSKNIRDSNQKYRDKYDIIQIRLPLSFSERIKNTNKRPKDFYNEAIEYELKLFEEALREE